MLTDAERTVLDAVRIETPWELVEAFSTMVREHPRDVNRAMDMVAERLGKHGVPVTMHEPTLYLSLPGKARVEAGGKTYRAKPPAYEPFTLPGNVFVQDLLVPEEGLSAANGDLVTIHYVGRLADGTVFDSSYERGVPIAFRLGAGEVPEGLELGLAGMREHGRRTLTVPSELGYGEEGLPGVVPGSATLSFEVELLSIERETTIAPPEAPSETPPEPPDDGA